MKAKLIVEGKEFDIEINDPELEKLVKPPKKTGYERVEEETHAYYVGYDGEVNNLIGSCYNVVNDAYIAGNYYSDRTVAENNARADKLMRQLRRFAVEHRENSICWVKGFYNSKWRIVYDCPNNVVRPIKGWDVCSAFAIYFDTEKAANLAVETFHDELVWYFTEYKDSL